MVQKNIKLLFFWKKQFEKLKSGKDRLQGFFVGQVMKKTSGSASPQVVNKLLKDKLSK